MEQPPCVHGSTVISAVVVRATYLAERCGLLDRHIGKLGAQLNHTIVVTKLFHWRVIDSTKREQEALKCSEWDPRKY